MKKKQLIHRKEHLENINRQLLEELQELDELMRKAGFSNGLLTVKETARFLADGEKEEEGPDDLVA